MSKLPKGHTMPKPPPPKKRGAAGHAAKVGAICGAKRRGGGKCRMAAGWGTDHTGIGACKLHGGSMPNHVKAAASAEYRILLGNPIEINPLDALMMCIKIRAGEVEWLSQEMAKLDSKAWVETTLVGKQFHLYARERAAALNDLARYSQMAINLGLAERAVKLAEMYGETIARLLNGILGELKPYMNEEGIALIQQVVRRHLILISGGSEEESAKELRQIEGRSKRKVAA